MKVMTASRMHRGNKWKLLLPFSSLTSDGLYRALWTTPQDIVQKSAQLEGMK